MLSRAYIEDVLKLTPGIHLITTHGVIVLIDIRESLCGGRIIDQYPLGNTVDVTLLLRLLDWLGVLSPWAAYKIADLDYQCDTFARMVRDILALRHGTTDEQRRAA